MSRPRLADQVAIVTGASRGIGAAVARAYAAEGASVAVACEPRPEPVAQATRIVAELTGGGARAIAVASDLADPAAIDRSVVEIRDQLGPIDIVVNNAAASPRSDWRATTVEEWDHVQHVNTRGAWLLARAAYPDLCHSENASVINVTSVMVETGGSPGALSYITSKAALVGLTRALARELGPDGVRVNAVMPGAIRTEYEVAHAPDATEILERVTSRQALDRRGYAEDVAGTFVFLASPESSFITGQVINVDGGWVHY
ncbi:SDR family NAD(P)-dependent oxidoreductase [Nitriliruptor alkaliphilus]|uniref:SDR family NAD(P)-dependent oxidoreductase n=1 Tax=Nitriliruptor alkaliphilus TaxID=427918 RepID=UPI000696F26C|nr:SDR family oxidoreductase [Nitriliruptor alkaliphilus]